MSIRCDIYDRSQYAIWFAAAPYSAAGKPAKTLRQWAADESADIVYNLALFNMTGQGSDRYGVIKGRTLQYLKAKGRECGYGGTPERLVLDSSNAVSGWKLAVKDGKVSSTLGKSDRRSRKTVDIFMCRPLRATPSTRWRSTSATATTSSCCSCRTQAAARGCIARRTADCSRRKKREQTADRCAVWFALSAKRT